MKSAEAGTEAKAKAKAKAETNKEAEAETKAGQEQQEHTVSFGEVGLGRINGMACSSDFFAEP